MVFIYINHSLDSNSFKFCPSQLNLTENGSNYWVYAIGNNQILQQATSDFLQRATSATINEGILQRVTSDFFFVTSNFCNE